MQLTRTDAQRPEGLEEEPPGRLVQRPIFVKVPADLNEAQLMDVGETLIAAVP